MIKHVALLVTVAAIAAPGLTGSASAADPGTTDVRSAVASQSGIGMDAIVIYGCRSQGKTPTRGDDGHWNRHAAVARAARQASFPARRHPGWDLLRDRLRGGSRRHKWGPSRYPPVGEPRSPRPGGQGSAPGRAPLVERTRTVKLGQLTGWTPGAAVSRCAPP